MNPYKFMKGLVKSVVVAAPVLLFAGAETAFWLPYSIAKAEEKNMRDNFAQTEIFQTLKSEEDAKLADMKQNLEIAQEQQSKGELETQTYLDMKYEYDQRYSFVNSNDYVVSEMEKYDNGVYTNYENAHSAAFYCMVGGVYYSLLGALATAAAEMVIFDEVILDIDCYFDDKIDAYDEKKKSNHNDIKQTKELI